MKTLNLFYLIISSLFVVGCSDSSDDTEAIINRPSEQPDSTIRIKFGEGDSQITSSPTLRAAKVEHIFRLTLQSYFTLTFDENGHFGHIKYNMPPSYPPATTNFHSLRAFSSNYMNFNLESIDINNKRVKGNFYGFLYHDPFNPNSESAFISSEFDLIYEDVIPAAKNFGVKANINDDDWIYTDWYTTPGSQNNFIVDNYVSDDEYKFAIEYMRNTQTGTYNFSPGISGTKIIISKYETVSGVYIDYLCAGTINFIEKNNDVYRGTFQFTGVNPQNPTDVIVSEGIFKTRDKNAL